MTTVETLVKIRGDTSQLQSFLKNTTKTLDKYMNTFKKRVETLNKLKVTPKIEMIDNATDALKKIEALSNRVKDSLSSIPVTVNLSSAEQELAKLVGNAGKRMNEAGTGVFLTPAAGVLPAGGQGVTKAGANGANLTQEAGGSSGSERAARTLAVVAGAAPFILAEDSWKKSRTPKADIPALPDGNAASGGTSLWKKVLPKLGKAAASHLGPLSIASGLVGVVNSDNKGKAAAEMVGSIIGGIGGTVVGGPLGGFAGSLGGQMAAGKLYDFLFQKKEQSAATEENSTSTTTQLAESGKAVSEQQKRMASTGQVYLDSQNNIVTSNGFVVNSQNNLMQAFTTLAQALDFASAKLIAFSGVQYLPSILPNSGTAGNSREEFHSIKGYENHATGGILSKPHLGLVAEAGPEAVIPLSARMRGRALALWQQAGQYLGVRPYAAGGFAGVMPVPAVAGGGETQITVPVNVNLQVGSENIDYENIKNEVGWKIARSIKNALENKAVG